MTWVAGVDVGATSIRAALADESGGICGRASRTLPESRRAAVDTIRETVTEATAAAGVDPERIAAVGVGSMGPLDVDSGAIVEPPNASIDRLPVTEPISDVVDADVSLYNDATAGVIGEQYAADGRDNLAYVTISTGIGVGAIVDGTILRGASGNAAELGHVTLEPDIDLRCGCGATGHWEGLCSGANIGQTVRYLADGAGTDLDLVTVDGPALFSAAGEDPLADRVLDHLAEWNTRGVAAVVHAFDPASVHIGGGVAINNPDRVVDPIRKRLPAHLVADPPEVAVASFGRDAVLRGAIAAVLPEKIM